MRKPLICAVAPLLAAATVSCSMISGYSTDKAASYARAIELVKTNVDTDKFKIYSIDYRRTGTERNRGTAAYRCPSGK